MRRTLKNTAKKAKGLIRKIAGVLALGSFLLGYNQKANGEVVFTMEPKNTIDFPSRAWEPNSTLKLYVYADNTSENEATFGLELKISPPDGMNFFGTGHLGTNDFFNGYQMSTNEIGLNGIKRYTKTTLGSDGNIIRVGPKQKKAPVALFNFDIPANTPLGYKTFRIDSDNVKAYDTNGAPQLARGTDMTIQIIPSYSILRENPIIIQDINKDIDGNVLPYVNVTDFQKQQILETTTDMKNWSPLKTNNVFNYQYNLWMPFDFVDYNAKNNPTRFYRAKTAN